MHTHQREEDRQLHCDHCPADHLQLVERALASVDLRCGCGMVMPYGRPRTFLLKNFFELNLEHRYAHSMQSPGF